VEETRDEESECRAGGSGGRRGWDRPPAVHAQAGQKGAGLAERIQDLNLTDAQEAKIAEIRKEYRPKVQEAGNKLCGTVHEEVEKVLAVLKG
jgi:Spy/CpxP family protein refolding chaperone